MNTSVLQTELMLKGLFSSKRKHGINEKNCKNVVQYNRVEQYVLQQNEKSKAEITMKGSLYLVVTSSQI